MKDSLSAAKSKIEGEHLRLIFEQSADYFPENIALMCDDVYLSYAMLEAKANQLANYLIAQGVDESCSIGILLPRSLESYITFIAVLKTGAIYVPLEVGYPDERIQFIASDMALDYLITTELQYQRDGVKNLTQTVLLDTIEYEVKQQPKKRPVPSARGDDGICYVIYTSGSTGKPKGVEVSHHNICHYVRVASQLYDIHSSDRIYQGFSLAFDASMEEVWMAFANGAALIACTSKDIRSGVGLIDFLNHHGITVFSTVPTLLATLQGELPYLKLLILGGEACPDHLVQRWMRPQLRILNTYGPTEATVIATYCECTPNQPVTIGKPLPGYAVVILDEQLQVVPSCAQGELCIAGNGLARGYVNRPDLTASKFIQNPNNPTQRLYRTGDLAKINTQGNIEFLGRVDDQIKLRGFRIELNEIETVIMQFPGIEQAVVALQDFGQSTLVAYLLLNNKKCDLLELKKYLHDHLPHYMLPTHFEILEAFPCLSSGKVDRKALPKPSRQIVENIYVAPENELQQCVADIWHEYLQQETISIEADFFYDLGGHSLSAAQVISRLRGIPGMESISILDLYNHPSIRQLCEKFKTIQHAPHQETKRSITKYFPNKWSYLSCSVGQFFGCVLQFAINAWQLLAIIFCVGWIEGKSYSLLSMQGLLMTVALFIIMPAISLGITISAKWLLLGKVKPGTYKLWGWFYWRWWLVMRMQENVFNPRHLSGTPLLSLYYRLLGAKIGKNCYIATSYVGVHDMLEIGDDSSIGYDARLWGYVVEDGWLKIGKVSIGNHCFVGARSVMAIDTAIENRAALDDMSLLPTRHTIPSGQFYAGSPATSHDAPSKHITKMAQQRPKSSGSITQSIFNGIYFYGALLFTLFVYYICFLPALLMITYFHEQSHYLLTITIAAPLGAIIFLASYYLGVACCKRILMHRIKPGIYNLYGFYHMRQWTITQLLDNAEVLVLSDTLYFPLLLRFLGAKLGNRVEIGMAPHLIPDLITIDEEGFAASDVGLGWSSVYGGQIQYAPVRVGKRGFIGNDSLLPLGDCVGDEGLLGCMSITPPNNKASHHHTAWLGSPPVFLPKREEYCGFSEQEKFLPPLKLLVLRYVMEFFKIIFPTTFTLVGLFNMLYILHTVLADASLRTILLYFPLALMITTGSLVTIAVGLKWLLIGKLAPDAKPIWNAFIWRNDIIKDLYTFFVVPQFAAILVGTPFFAVLLRALGAKIGKQVYIDLANFEEFDLSHIGDNVCLNPQAGIQTHLYEDRVFKMSRIMIHSGCNVGVASIVLYNTIMEENASLGDFSLLMKGERLPADSNWEGIPAQHRAHYAQEIHVTEDIESDAELIETL